MEKGGWTTTPLPRDSQRAMTIDSAEAIQRLSRSPHWVWAAMDPVTKLLLTIDVGDRTLAMAQCVVHQITQVLAPACMPLFLTDGFRERSSVAERYDSFTQAVSV